eukprot:6596615-Prymnesium_polylepis.1
MTYERSVARGRATVSTFSALSIHARDRWRMVSCFRRAGLRYRPINCCHARGVSLYATALENRVFRYASRPVFRVKRSTAGHRTPRGLDSCYKAVRESRTGR